MAGTTLTQGLSYSTGDDPIVAAGEQVQRLAEQIDARLDRHDRELAVSRTPPLTVVESRVATEFERGFGASSLFTFDTVLVDTQGGADLAVDSRVIKINRPGYWNVGGIIRTHVLTGAITMAATLFLVSDNLSLTPNVDNSQFEGGSGIDLSVATICRASTANNMYISMGLNANGVSSGASTVTPYYRRMWAYWLGDL